MTPALAVLALAVVALGGCRTAGEFELTGATSHGDAPVALRAGVADVVFTPPPGYPLGGFGGGERRVEFPFYFGMGWPGRLALWAHQRAHEEGPDRSDMLAPSEGVHDELTARALVLRPASGPPVAIVRIDAIGATAELHDLITGSLADLGYQRSTVLLAATHTHSGVGAFMRAPLACLVGMDNYRPEVEARIAAACAGAIRLAHERARPAAIGVGRAHDTGEDGRPQLARNRRDASDDDAVDREVLLLRVDDAETLQPMAVVINYAVHGTVLGQKNLQFSGDVADGIEDRVGARLGGVPVLFLNGAEGDIAPARPAGTGGFARIAALGELMADLVAPALARVRVSTEARVLSASGDLELGDAHIVMALGREAFVEDYRDAPTWLSSLLVAPLEAVFAVVGMTNLHPRLSWSLRPGLVIDLDHLVGRTRTRVAGLRFLIADDDVLLLGVPGEATHDVGLALKQMGAARGASTVLVVGLANDHIGYIASREKYVAGGYEARLTLFGPDTADHVQRALGHIMSALGYAKVRDPLERAN